MTHINNNLPEGWQITKLGQLASVNNGKSNTQDAVDDGSYVFFDRSREIKSSNRYLFDCDAIIVPGEGKEFIPQIHSGKFDLHQRAYAIHSFHNDVDFNYLYYFIHFNREVFLKKAVGSTVKSLRLGQFNEFPVVLPPLSQQKTIAQILTTVDSEIHKTDEIIEQAELLKKGLMQDLFTKGIGHKKFQQTKLGMIPEEWEVLRLEDVSDVERGKFSHRPRNDERFYGGNIPFIQTGDVVNSNGRITKYCQTLNELGLSVSRLFQKGTIVLTIAANIGDTGILEFDSCFPDSLVGISVNEKVTNHFLEYYLKTRKNYLNAIATQSAQKNINLEKLRPLLVVVPSIEEQAQIAHILYGVDEKISKNLKIKHNLKLLKLGLMQDLLTGRKLVN